MSNIDIAESVIRLVRMVTEDESLDDIKIKKRILGFTYNVDTKEIGVPKYLKYSRERDIKLILYINNLYGLDLDSNDMGVRCIFGVLHEIGHHVDLTSKKKQGEKVYNDYLELNYKIKKELRDKFDKNNKDMSDTIQTLRDRINELYEKKTELEKTRSSYYNDPTLTELLNEYERQCTILENGIESLEELKNEIQDKIDYDYRQIVGEYEADKWAALFIKKYDSLLNNIIKNDF